MDGIEGLLARDFGVRPQGKAAPMAGAAAASSRSAGSAAAAWSTARSAPPSSSAAPSYDDLFGAPAPAPATAHANSFDSLFDSFNAAPTAKPTKAAPSPAPAFDDDVFDAVPGLRPSHSTPARYDDGAAYEDLFATTTTAAARSTAPPPPAYDDDDFLGGFGSSAPRTEAAGDDDDLLGVLGRSASASGASRRPPAGRDGGAAGAGFDDLIPGFAGSRKANDDNKMKPPVPTSKQTASMADDPFVVLETASASGSAYTSPGRSTDPLEDLDNSANSESKAANNTADDDSSFEESNPFDQALKSDPLFASETNDHAKGRNPPNVARDSSPLHHSMDRNPVRQSSMEDFSNVMPKSQSARFSDIPGNDMEDQSPRSTESEDDIWLTVSEIPLFTKPTTAPPPSRSPPLPKQKPMGANANGKENGHVRRSSQNHNHHTDLPKRPEVSSIDDLESFATGKPQMPAYDSNVFDEDFERSSGDREEKDRQERLEQEREMKLREEMERERRRLEKERELEQQRERERERQAVERATKEARERAAAEARAKAEREARQRAQRAAVQRAQQEARERAAVEAKERAARVAAEARERAAAEAKEKAAAEAKERAAAEAKERERAAARERVAAERAAAERAQQEARKRAERAAVERAASEARERQAAAAAAAAAAAREKQSTPDDLESFFGVDARASSAPKQRAPTPTVDSMFGFGAQGRGSANGSHRAASTSAPVRKAASATVFGDDLSDLFGAPASSDVFQEVEGETEERRRARLERHQRTRERAAKALAEKNERDMQVQREQAERDRIGDTLDFEIKRWSAGKEGNLRALLSTLQYILWPECGWQAVSLTDLITGAAVKKQYRKATLCIHPDKVQQKGATLQQKYIAEKVFDILKEAWNKFNSEELF
ncbi:hypothetical protein U9M48_001314 [Paspalum notatum var. saurae]|uniref:J domain-containing protein n=1 Tax=Paspalum notatum var. saurae TaxID=547442 RepID=A0AAQ3PHZ1_PASNO